MKTLAPSGNWAVVGNSPRPSEKTRMKSTAQTNSGIAVADRPPTEIRRSRKLPSFIAATTPPTIASGTTMMKASSASLPEATIASTMMSDTGRFWRGRLAEIAGHEARDPVPVLRDQRLVGAQLLAQRVDRGLVGERAQDAPRDVARQHLGGQEDHDAQQQQRDQAESDALGQEAGDGGLSLERPRPRAQAFTPAWVTSTWPIADTLTPAMVGLSAER